MPKKIHFHVQRFIQGQWRTVAIGLSLGEAVRLAQILGKDARIVSAQETVRREDRRHFKKSRSESRYPDRFMPWWLSPYIALSIKLHGDMSLAYDLLLKEYYSSEPRRAEKLKALVNSSG